MSLMYPLNMSRYLVHSNVSFSSSEDWFFHDFVHEIRPSYDPPTRYVLSHTILGSEVSRSRIEDIDRIKSQHRLTILIDGWEDLLKRSLYGSLLAQVRQYPTILGLHDMTGTRGTADAILDVALVSLQKLELQDEASMRKVVGLTTDNPTTMQSFRRKVVLKYYWILVRRVSNI